MTSPRIFGAFDYRKALAIGTPKALMQMRIKYSDGTVQTIVTDDNWMVGEGPLLR
jgi:hypothetical protein